MRYTNIASKWLPIENTIFGSVVKWRNEVYLVLDMLQVDVPTRSSGDNISYMAKLTNGEVIGVPWGTNVEIIEDANDSFPNQLRTAQPWTTI